MPTSYHDAFLQAPAARYSLSAHAQAFDANAAPPPESADALASVDGAYQNCACIDAWMPPADTMAYAYWNPSVQAAPLMHPQPAPAGAPSYIPLWPQWDASSIYMGLPMPIEEHAVDYSAAQDMPRHHVGVAGPVPVSAGAGEPSYRPAQAQAQDVRPADAKARGASKRYALVNAKTGAPATADDTCVIHLQTWRKRRPVDAHSGHGVPAGTPGAVPRWRYERTRWPLKSQAKGLRNERLEKAKVAQQK